MLHLSENCQTTNVQITSLRPFRGCQKQSKGPHGLGGLWHGQLRSKQTNKQSPILIHRCVFKSMADTRQNALPDAQIANVACQTAMVLEYVKCGQRHEGSGLIQQMQMGRNVPNPIFIFVELLNAMCQCCSTWWGQNCSWTNLALWFVSLTSLCVIASLTWMPNMREHEGGSDSSAWQGAQDFAVFWMSMILWYLKCEERQNALKLLKENAIWRDDVTPHHFCRVPKGMCLCSCISRGKVACSWARSYKVVACLMTLSKRCRDSYCTFCLSFIISLQSGQPALFTKAHTPFSTNSATMSPMGWCMVELPGCSGHLQRAEDYQHDLVWSNCFCGHSLASSLQDSWWHQVHSTHCKISFQVCIMLLVKWDLPARIHWKWNRAWENSHGGCELTLQKN